MEGGYSFGEGRLGFLDQFLYDPVPSPCTATSTTQPGSPLRYNEVGAVLKIPCASGVAIIGQGRKAGIGKRSMRSNGKADRANPGATSKMDIRFGLPYIEVAFVAHESKR